jgi:hypothetical protein
MTNITPMSVKIVHDTDLPHGPYVNLEGTVYVLYCDESCSYEDASRFVMKKMDDDRNNVMAGVGTQMNHSNFGVSSQVKMEHQLKDIIFKGGPILMNATCAEGIHNFNVYCKMDISHKQVCCIIV